MTMLLEAERFLGRLTKLEKIQLMQRIADELRTEGRPIIQTKGVLGGDARVDGTRIPVWVLVNWRRLGLSDEEILNNYPTLTVGDLINALAYYDQHPDEIERSIYENEAE